MTRFGISALFEIHEISENCARKQPYFTCATENGFDVEDAYDEVEHTLSEFDYIQSEKSGEHILKLVVH